MKRCNSCRQLVDDFVGNVCFSCESAVGRRAEKGKEYKQANKEHIKEYQKEWCENNPEYHKEYGKEYYQGNIMDCKERMKEWYQDNKEHAKERMKEYGRSPKAKAATRLKQHKKKLRVPPWYDHKKVIAIYKESAALGLLYHVDHIVPLFGEFVSGLHVHYNLQVITAEENLSKGNSFDRWTHVHVLPKRTW